MKTITILGSTGSIGRQSLDVVRAHRSEFTVSALTCGKNIALFREQLKEFKPALAVCAEKDAAESLVAEFPGIRFLWGPEGILEAAVHSDGEMVVNSLLGMMGIAPTYEAIKAGKAIAFANKETLVAGGSLIMDAVKRYGVDFLPVDSEHSAIFQCLQGRAGNPLRRIILTASGGPFRGFTKEQMRSVTKEQALKHPRWTMGAKITIDSATMMNKGLEIIEASWLFDMPADKIEVHVHPESILHSAVEFEDGSVLGQMGNPDMRVPIAYALSWPKRLPLTQDDSMEGSAVKPLDLFAAGALHFEKPDLEAFQCLALAYKAIELGKSYPIVLNAANEEAVAAFLADRIAFWQIGALVEKAMTAHRPAEIACVEDIFEVERETREIVLGAIQ
ncbi:MAG: 1-deoxy-D-xylulose-5-phosphate reductoisomerase [Firmicutes bacterium]|nr:1-deoxy-D-xylulose-5-phosphate reductoisomerase [Bacillota bacterium]MBQ4004076.1 1-deoxy-D-xylulose-5-phosphate reductoisomerase [Bacillota bacterium]